MAKSFIRIEADRIRVFRLKKGPRQMVTINSRLYRIDDDYFLSDKRTGDAIIIYRIDSTQPIMQKPTYIDPDMTRAYIDYAKIGRNKKRIWSNLTASKITNAIVPALIIGGVIYGVMMGGGL